MRGTQETRSIGEHALRAERCDFDFACLEDTSFCACMKYTNRDVDVLKCLETCPCGHRKSCDGLQICTCSVKLQQYELS
ncbi:hypothetical protein [Thiosocius teredinicola]|uniref:hypothetical protein n=1 Tax=Thiosocius teredinicola TaxID=1973002 RepID=UPI000F7AE3B8